ncbi:MAG: J domain-containing protein [Opitutaceae bacterium]|nr:J domain-containing protein [Opitutaceae bacterium]
MPVEFKDYYAVLGVPREASQEDIKKSFRKLAREHHPDIAKNKKTAEEKFKEINEANEVLSDPEKRRKYDELGANWESGGSAPPRGARHAGWAAADGGQDYEVHFGGTGFSDFFEQFFGGAQRGGDFDDVFRHARRSTTGATRDVSEPGQDIEGEILVTLDEVLHGSVRSISLRRVNPRNSHEETETFQVRIPAGAQEGRRIRVPGKGGPGYGGGSAGNLYLRVRIAQDPNFQVRGSDLYHDLELAPWEAVLGTELLVPTPSGRVKLRIPPGTNNGHQLRVRGQGLPRGAAHERGDLYVIVNVQLPGKSTTEERALWEQLSRVSGFNPRAG